MMTPASDADPVPGYCPSCPNPRCPQSDLLERNLRKADERLMHAMREVDATSTDSLLSILCQLHTPFFDPPNLTICEFSRIRGQGPFYRPVKLLILNLQTGERTNIYTIYCQGWSAFYFNELLHIQLGKGAFLSHFGQPLKENEMPDALMRETIFSFPDTLIFHLESANIDDNVHYVGLGEPMTDESAYCQFNPFMDYPVDGFDAEDFDSGHSSSSGGVGSSSGGVSDEEPDPVGTPTPDTPRTWDQQGRLEPLPDPNGSPFIPLQHSFEQASAALFMATGSSSAQSPPPSPPSSPLLLPVAASTATASTSDDDALFAIFCGLFGVRCAIQPEPLQIMRSNYEGLGPPAEIRTHHSLCQALSRALPLTPEIRKPSTPVMHRLRAQWIKGDQRLLTPQQISRPSQTKGHPSSSPPCRVRPWKTRGKRGRGRKPNPPNVPSPSAALKTKYNAMLGRPTFIAAFPQSKSVLRGRQTSQTKGSTSSV